MPVRNRVIAAAFGAAIALASIMVGGFEGTRYTAYRDTGGIYTICTGHTRGVKQGDVATPAQCEQWLAEDLQQAADAVAQCVIAPLTANQAAAFIDVAYNIGTDTFCASSMARNANRGNIRGACQSIGLYMFVAHKDCRIAGSNCTGIVKRRKAEMALCWPSWANVVSGSQSALR